MIDHNKFSFRIYNLPALSELSKCESEEESDKMTSAIIERYTTAIEQIPEAVEMIRQLELYQESFKTEENRIKEKRQRAEKVKDRIENALISLIEKSGSDSINIGTFDISIRNTESISDEFDQSLVPQEYINTVITQKLDKVKIKKALKEGINIPVKVNINKHLKIK